MSTTVRIDYHLYDRYTEEFAITFVINSDGNTSEYFIDDPNSLPKSSWLALSNHVGHSYELKFDQSSDTITISSTNGLMIFTKFDHLSGKSYQTSVSSSYVIPQLLTLIDRLELIRS